MVYRLEIIENSAEVKCNGRTSAAHDLASGHVILQRMANHIFAPSILEMSAILDKLPLLLDDIMLRIDKKRCIEFCVLNGCFRVYPSVVPKVLVKRFQRFWKKALPLLEISPVLSSTITKLPLNAKGQFGFEVAVDEGFVPAIQEIETLRLDWSGDGHLDRNMQKNYGLPPRRFTLTSFNAQPPAKCFVPRIVPSTGEMLREQPLRMEMYNYIVGSAKLVLLDIQHRQKDS
jgi:hypothetical protein